jgi:hypothetical protein
VQDPRIAFPEDWKSEILFRLRQGPRRTLAWVVDRFLDTYRDKHFGIVSAQRRSRHELALDSPDFEPYQALSYLDLRGLFNRLTVRPDDVFVDYGSGMGRAICVAATYPFRAVWGVEISGDLCQLAERNIQLAQPRFRCGQIKVLNADALEFPIPRDASIIFLFNPFGGSVLSGVMERIGESFNSSRREIRLIFCGTVSTSHFREEALRHSWLSLESEIVLSTGVVALCYVTHS